MSAESAINESLRLSSASMNIRVAQEDFSLRLDGERSVGVRKDDIVILYPQSLHMDPEIYDQPQVWHHASVKHKILHHVNLMII